MDNENEIVQRLTEICDLLAAREQQYSDYLARYEETSKMNMARAQQYVKQPKRFGDRAS